MVVRSWCQRFLRVAFSITALLSLASFFGYTGWFCDLLSQLRIIWLIAFGIFGLLYMLFSDWPLVALSLMLLGFQLSQCLGFLPAYSLHHISKQSSNVTVLYCNVWGEKNHNITAFLRLVKQVQPNIIGLSEYTSYWQHTLPALMTSIGYRYRITRDTKEEIALYSRVPLQHPQVWWTKHNHPVEENVESVIVADVLLHQTPMTVLTLHPLTPIKQHINDAHQQVHLSMLEQHASALKPSVLLMGDLNTTPWTVPYHRLLRQLHLIDSEEGIGIQPSWPTWSPTPLVPIDHVLYRGALQVVSRRVMPAIGSDHYPVVVQFYVP